VLQQFILIRGHTRTKQHTHTTHTHTRTHSHTTHTQVLVSDALRGFGQEEAKANLRAVSAFMHETEMAALAAELGSGLHEQRLASRSAIKRLLHERGVNMRHLRKLAEMIDDSSEARRKLMDHLNNSPPVQELVVKTLSCPRTQTEEELRRILEMQRKVLPPEAALHLVPTLLMLARLSQAPLDTGPHACGSRRLVRPVGTHPLAEALAICEQHDPAFLFRAELSRIVSCGPLTLQVMYELLRKDRQLSFPGEIPPVGHFGDCVVLIVIKCASLCFFSFFDVEIYTYRAKKKSCFLRPARDEVPQLLCLTESTLSPSMHNFSHPKPKSALLRLGLFRAEIVGAVNQHAA
jgi:DNA-directed RNA polymerase subunit F